MTLEIPGPDLGQTQKCGSVKLIKGIPPTPLDNTVNN